MRRAPVLITSVLTIALAALAACSKAPSKSAAAASDLAASSAPLAAPAPAASSAEARPAHHWATVNDKQYLYYSHAQAEGGAPGEVVTTTIRYLGQASDGSYVVAEVEGGAMVLASCTLPCTLVRLRGQGMDQTVPLGDQSVVKAALDDAITGQLEPSRLNQKAPAGK
jgi:hypothetical protein